MIRRRGNRRHRRRFATSAAAQTAAPAPLITRWRDAWRDYLQRHPTEARWHRRLLSGPWTDPPRYFYARWLFLRVLGIICFIAFASLWGQIGALFGSEGILPAAQLMEAVHEKLGIVGLWTYPSLAWFSHSDSMLYALCGVGAFASVMLTVGVLPSASLAVVWLCYLSLSTVARVFLGFQWDTLLLEVVFLGMLLAPGQLLPRWSRERAPSFLSVLLIRLLLFRLMVSSGIAKLTSGDTAWRQLEALLYHYETQPIPNALAWFAHHLPAGFHSASVAIMFLIQLLLPLLIFTPRIPRLIGAVAIASLQILILLTGNYCFFNLLSLALCLLLLDDQLLSAFLPKRIPRPPAKPEPPFAVARIAVAACALIILPLAYIQMKPRVFKMELGPVEKRLQSWAAPFRTVNGYGLFADMTESRPEIEVQGSHDGVEWKTYVFHYKPGPLDRRPPQVAPHQPRLDWQMWFEALRVSHNAGPSEWFKRFLICLLEGREVVLTEMAENPFPDEPPRFVRAHWHNYRFTTTEQRSETGDWWQREEGGVYVRPSSLPSK
ncbi:MAG: hypothetical protein ACI8W8_000952 [Rhodothermales bacterium]